MSTASAEQEDATEKVLVVDDEPDVMDLAAALFRSIGYEVYTANNGYDALEILQRSADIGVLFSDVMMPNMSGIELATRARILRPDMPNCFMASVVIAFELLLPERTDSSHPSSVNRNTSVRTW